MKKTILFIAIATVAVAMGSCSTKVSTRNLSYEQYCDSVWEADPDYYMDVLMESDEYCAYIEENGAWFKE